MKGKKNLRIITEDLYFKVLPYSVISFFESIGNLIRWFPTIWRQKDFDSFYFYEIVQKKIKFQLKNFSRYSEEPDQEKKYMKICIDLIEKIKEDFYSLEYTGYRKIEMVKEGKITRFKVISENNSDFLKKYPLVHRKLKNKNPDQSEESFCIMVSVENHKRAKDLLYRILSEKLEEWWF